VISYIVASNRPDVLADNLEATLRLIDEDELIVVHDPPSIAVAYNEGQAKASNPIRCYVHSDVWIYDPERLRDDLVRRCGPGVGMVGVVGSRTRVVPWWIGTTCGSVVDARMGLIDRGNGGVCSYLDGLLLATVHDLTWDESYSGFHLYDHDICQQMLDRGLPNLCLSGGAQMILHNTTSSSDTSQLDGWDDALARFHDKWGTSV
jgi:hypothetical protein